ncbi:hypothetical protein MTR62_17605, partial [Novosphingobium sp. 1949]
IISRRTWREVNGGAQVALLSLLATGCSTQTPEKTLGPCWNVNDLESGLITGRGVFIRSMHGLSLQAPGCSDRSGGNSFELSRPAELEVREFLIGSSDGHYISFAFHGYVESGRNRNILLIE